MPLIKKEKFTSLQKHPHSLTSQYLYTGSGLVWNLRFQKIRSGSDNYKNKNRINKIGKNTAVSKIDNNSCKIN